MTSHFLLQRPGFPLWEEEESTYAKVLLFVHKSFQILNSRVDNKYHLELIIMASFDKWLSETFS